MRRLLRSRFILHLIAAVMFPLLLTAGLSCNAPAIGSPYMPIPPPTFGPATQEIDSEGITHTYWKVTGPPSPELPELFDIYVYLTNIDMGPGTVGSIARTAQDGSYTTRIEGQRVGQCCRAGRAVGGRHRSGGCALRRSQGRRRGQV